MVILLVFRTGVRLIDPDGRIAGDPITKESVKNRFHIIASEGNTYFVNRSNFNDAFFFNPEGTSTEFGFARKHGVLKSYHTEKISDVMRKNIGIQFAMRVAREEYDAVPVPGEINIIYDFDQYKEIANRANQISGEPLGKTFRHRAWQAYLTIRYGESYAQEVGDFYERNSDRLPGRNFDLINNNIGRQWGLELKGEFDFSTEVGVADFLNEISNRVRIEEGLEPLEGDYEIFHPEKKDIDKLTF